MSCPTEMLLIICLCNVIKNKSEFERKCLLSCFLTCWHYMQTSEIEYLRWPLGVSAATAIKCILVQIKWPCWLINLLIFSVVCGYHRDRMIWALIGLLWPSIFLYLYDCQETKQDIFLLAAFTNKKSLTVV